MFSHRVYTESIDVNLKMFMNNSNQLKVQG